MSAVQEAADAVAPEWSDAFLSKEQITLLPLVLDDLTSEPD